MLDYFCANSNFNRLNGSKEQSPKLLIKGIQVDNICKTTTFSKLMRSVVSFKMSPITSKTKIAYDVKGFLTARSTSSISKPLSLRISICCSVVMARFVYLTPINKNVPLGTLILREASGICWCKGN